MSLIDDCRAGVRVVSDMTDGEIQLLIDAAIAEMRRVGIRESLLRQEDMDPLARYAVLMHVKANYGNDNATEFAIWWQRFQLAVTSMMNSPMNECYEQLPDAQGGDGQ